MTSSVFIPPRHRPPDLKTPNTLSALLKLVAEGHRPLAGGTDIVVESRQDLAPSRLAWTGGVAEFSQITEDGSATTIGAGVTLEALVRSRSSRDRLPAVTDGAHVIGSVQIRTTGTVAGNVCTASPAGDTLPGLYVHDAIVDTASHGGVTRSIPIGEFIQGPGSTQLGADEVVTAIRCETNRPREGSAFARFTERGALDLAFASVAARVGLDHDGTISSLRLALGAVGPTVIDASEAATNALGREPNVALIAAVAETAAAMAAPITDLRASADYRRRLVVPLVRDVVAKAVDRAQMNISE